MEDYYDYYKEYCNNLNNNLNKHKYRVYILWYDTITGDKKMENKIYEFENIQKLKCYILDKISIEYDKNNKLGCLKTIKKIKEEL